MKDFLGFRPKRSALGNGGLPAIERKIIISATTLREGGAVRLGTSGIEDLDSATEDFLGYCVGFEDRDGFSYEVRTSGFEGSSATYTQNAQGDTHLASDDNATAGSDGVVALVIPAEGVICSGYLSATSTGGTTGSTLIGYYLDIDTGNEEQLDETSATTNKTQWFLMPGVSGRSAIDPEHPDSTRRVMVMGREIQQVTTR